MMILNNAYLVLLCWRVHDRLEKNHTSCGGVNKEELRGASFTLHRIPHNIVRCLQDRMKHITSNQFDTHIILKWIFFVSIKKPMTRIQQLLF